MVDGSGLAARDRLTVGTVTSVLAAIVARPALRPVLAGLPVAGWSGTLDDRYVSGSARAAAGLVRAKTGTLTGVSALAGLVHDATGQLLVFDFDADRAGNTDAAESALDELASRLSACGCG
jgi:D-alanyl-D-alanine carboxypeptidase/D-alanyl-D-alanine-endopeptidase (penicillin-binding protein 4)